jgi:hypothetical protein
MVFRDSVLRHKPELFADNLPRVLAEILFVEMLKGSMDETQPYGDYEITLARK